MLPLACHDANSESPEFKEAKALLNTVIGETLDDTYEHPKFGAVQEAFQRVPNSAPDYDRAQRFVQDIGSAQEAARQQRVRLNNIDSPARSGRAATGSRRMNKQDYRQLTERSKKPQAKIERESRANQEKADKQQKERFKAANKKIESEIIPSLKENSGQLQ